MNELMLKIEIGPDSSVQRMEPQGRYSAEGRQNSEKIAFCNVIVVDVMEYSGDYKMKVD